jgi:hypothetical protein
MKLGERQIFFLKLRMEDLFSVLDCGSPLGIMGFLPQSEFKAKCGESQSQSGLTDSR